MPITRVLLASVLLPIAAACSSAEETTEAQDDPLSLPACAPTLSCGPPPLTHTQRKWRHSVATTFTRLQGAARHRGRDLMLNPGEPQHIFAKFAYGPADKDLKGEDVDIYVQRGCSGWEPLGTSRTTYDGEHATVDGVEDTGGRIYFEVPASKRLGLGQHRLRLVVAGDGTSTDLTLDIVPTGTRVFVSDIDGTLTTSEHAEVAKLVEGTVPDANPYAAQAHSLLAARGYRPVYLSARAEWLTQRTRDFLRAHGFPQGMVHTAFSSLGLIGAPAFAFKTAEIDAFAPRGLKISYAFGNRASDSEAYADANIQPINHRIFFKITEPYVGRKIESYSQLTSEFSALPRVCQ